MPEKKAGPPLWCLPVAVVLAALLCLVLGFDFFTQEQDLRTRDYSEAYCKYLKQVALERDPDKQIIVTLGASYLRYAVLEPEAFVEMGENIGVSDVILIRVLFSGNVHYLSKDMVSSLAALRPDVLLVQENALFYNNWRVGFRYHLKLKIKKLLSGTNNQFIESEDPMVFRFHVPRQRTVKRVSDKLIKRARENRRKSFNGGLREDLLFAIEACQLVGSKIVIAKVPVAERWEYSQADFKERKEILLEQLVESHKVQILKCPLPFSEQDYLDLSHMTLAGSEKYSRWLFDQLEEDLNELD